MKEKTIKVIFFVVVVLLMAIAIYYISKTKRIFDIHVKTKRIEEKTDQSIIMGITDYDTINPIVSKSQDIQYISKLIYKPLIDLTERFKLKPSIAEEWNMLDKKTYIIKLNENLYWSNGTKITSDDIKYTIEYIKQNDGVYSNNVNNIESIELLNDVMIKLSLKKEEEFFEYMLCFPIISKDISLSSGDYKIYNMSDNEIILEQEKTHNQLIIRNFENRADLYNAFSNNDVDFIITNNTNYMDYIGNIGYKKHIICGREFTFIQFNPKNKIIEKSEIVQALQYLINKKEIINKLYNSLFIEAEFPLRYGSYLYNNEIENDYNINKAQQILIENGWDYNGKKWTKNGQLLRLDIVTDDNKKEIANVIKEDIEKFGMELNVIVKGNPQEYFDNTNCAMIIQEKTVSIKPLIEEYLDFSPEKVETLEETYKKWYEQFKQKPTFIGICYDSVILLYSDNLRGDFNGNWYNVFYNIDTWYKTM